MTLFTNLKKIDLITRLVVRHVFPKLFELKKQNNRQFIKGICNNRLK